MTYIEIDETYTPRSANCEFPSHNDSRRFKRENGSVAIKVANRDTVNENSTS